MNINEITFAINGAVFEVNRVLGPGFLEKVYENALLMELRRRGLKAQSQVPIKVSYKGDVVVSTSRIFSWRKRSLLS
jgi:GxxExxY protein